jgi:hypothetical protein
MFFTRYYKLAVNWQDPCGLIVNYLRYLPLHLRILFVLILSMERLSISLDDESIAIIEKYLEKYQSKANLLRSALQCLKTSEEIQEQAPFGLIRTYINFLAKMEHVVIDIAHWEAMLSEIGEGSEDFWNEVRKIGEEHLKEFYDKGLREVRQILEYIEKKNWYKLNMDSESSFTLILTVSESKIFVKTFLEGIFKRYPKKVEISEQHKKIRIRVL